MLLWTMFCRCCGARSPRLSSKNLGPGQRRSAPSPSLELSTSSCSLSVTVVSVLRFVVSSFSFRTSHFPDFPPRPSRFHQKDGRGHSTGFFTFHRLQLHWIVWSLKRIGQRGARPSRHWNALLCCLRFSHFFTGITENNELVLCELAFCWEFSRPYFFSDSFDSARRFFISNRFRRGVASLRWSRPLRFSCAGWHPWRRGLRTQSRHTTQHDIEGVLWNGTCAKWKLESHPLVWNTSVFRALTCSNFHNLRLFVTGLLVLLYKVLCCPCWNQNQVMPCKSKILVYFCPVQWRTH